jgi:hypothetical protein
MLRHFYTGPHQQFCQAFRDQKEILENQGLLDQQEQWDQQDQQDPRELTGQSVQKDLPGRQGHKVFRAQKDHRVRKEFKVRLAQMGHKEFKVFRDPPGRLDPQVRKVFRAFRVLLGHKGMRGCLAINIKQLLRIILRFQHRTQR